MAAMGNKGMLGNNGVWLGKMKVQAGPKIKYK